MGFGKGLVVRSIPLFGGLLGLLFVAVTALTSARPVPDPFGLEIDRGSVRQLLEAYRFEVCTWRQGVSCQLNAEYGWPLIKSSTAGREDARLQWSFFKHFICEEAQKKDDCEVIDQCIWVEERKQCALEAQWSGQLAEECAAPGLEDFVSLYMKCAKASESSCMKEDGCVLVESLEDSTRLCRISGPKAIDLLLGSRISQVDMLQLLIDRAHELKYQGIPTIEEANEMQTVTGDILSSREISAGRRLQALSNPITQGSGLDSSFTRSGLIQGASSLIGTTRNNGNSLGGTGPQGGAASSGSQLVVLDDAAFNGRRSNVPDNPASGPREAQIPPPSPPPPPPSPPPPPPTPPSPPTPPRPPAPPGPSAKAEKPVSEKPRNVGSDIDNSITKEDNGSNGDGAGSPSEELSRTITGDGDGLPLTKAQTTELSLGDQKKNEIKSGKEGKGGSATVSPVTEPGTKQKLPSGGSEGDANTVGGRSSVQNGGAPGSKASKSLAAQEAVFTSEGGNDKNLTGAEITQGLDTGFSDPEFFSNWKYGSGTDKKEEIHVSVMRDIEAVMKNLLVVLDKKPKADSSAKKINEAMRYATKTLDNLRGALNQEKFDPEHARLKFLAEEVWWKLQLGAQEIGWEIYKGDDLARSIVRGGSQIIKAYLLTKQHWPEFDKEKSMKDLFDRVEMSVSNFRQALEAKSATETEMPAVEYSEVDIISLGELVSIITHAAVEKLKQMRPVILNKDFALQYEQTWVWFHYKRSQKWHNIREIINEASVLGDVLQEAVSGIEKILEMDEDNVTITLEQSSLKGKDVKRAAGSGFGDENLAAPSGGLDDLKYAVDDIVGTLVAIYEGNYTIADLPADLSTIGALEEWQKGPSINRKNITDAIANVTLNDSPLSSRNGFKEVVDDIKNILEAVTLIAEAKIFPRAINKPNLEPPPEESSIMLLLKHLQHLTGSWDRFNASQHGIDEFGVRKDLFGKYGKEIGLNWAGCVALGGRDEAKCSSIEWPTCQMRPTQAFRLELGREETEKDMCMPEPYAKFDRVLGEDVWGRSDMTHILWDLLDASATCSARTVGECGMDDMCRLTNSEECEISSTFINFKFQVDKAVGFAGVNQTCLDYMNLPTCSDFKSALTCHGSKGCVWANTDKLSLASNGTASERLASKKNKTGSPIPDETALPPEASEDHVSYTEVLVGPGECLDDWYGRMEEVIPRTEHNMEKEINVLKKHEECLLQLSQDSCNLVGEILSDDEDKEVGETDIPKGETFIKQLGPPLLSLLGTLIIFAILVTVWKYYKKKKKAQGGKGKRGRGKAKGKGKSDLKGKGKKVRKSHRHMAMPPAHLPPTFTVISPGHVTDGSKSRSDFSFVLGSIDGSQDSRGSGPLHARIPSRDLYNQHRMQSYPSEETGEICPVSDCSESEYSDSNYDSDSTTGWSSSSGWSMSGSEPEAEGYLEPESLARE